MKPYPCCRHTHPAVDAALAVRERTGGSSAARVRISTYPAALDVTNRPAPATDHEARFSIQYCVATALLRGRPGLDAFEESARSDEAVLKLLANTTVQTSDDLTAAYPQRWGAGVEVETAAGERVRVLKRSAKGDADLPLDDAQLDAKVLGLFAWGGLEEKQGWALLRRCRRLVRNGAVPALPRMGVPTLVAAAGPADAPGSAPAPDAARAPAGGPASACGTPAAPTLGPAAPPGEAKAPERGAPVP
jgi:2-methylcitrate dehydratase PrpD